MALDKATLVAFLDKDLKLDVASLSDDEPLFSSGMIDSFMLVQLMQFVEKQGGFRIPPGDVTLDNLDTVGRILAYARRTNA